MKMLFLDTVVMPVLSQMMRGKEILARACLCWALNTPGFSHQNLHGSIMDTMSEDVLRESILGWEDITWLELPPACVGAMGDSAQQHRREEHGFLDMSLAPVQWSLGPWVVHATTRVEESLGGICDLFS